MSDGNSILQGTVIDAESRKKLENIIITVTSPSLQGEQMAITDSSGIYAIENLPAGEYFIRAESDGYKSYHRGHINLRDSQSIRVNVELLPESIG
jgi:hypothetical protein